MTNGFNLLRMAAIFFLFQNSWAEAAPAAPTITTQCIQDVAKLIGIQQGETLTLKYKTNSAAASCDTKVTYNGDSLSFDFGMVKSKFKTLTFSSSLQTSSASFVDTTCEVFPGASVGVFRSYIGSVEHVREFDPFGGKTLGQTMTVIKFAKAMDGSPSFYIGIVDNQMVDEENPSTTNPDSVTEVTCWK